MTTEDLIEQVHLGMNLQGIPRWAYRVEAEHVEEIDTTILRIEGMLHRGPHLGWQKFGTQQYISGELPNAMRLTAARETATRYAYGFREAAA